MADPDVQTASRKRVPAGFVLRRPSVRSLVTFFLVFGLLVAPWPGLATWCSGWFCQCANVVVVPAFQSAQQTMILEPGARAAEWRPRVVVHDAASGARVFSAALQIRRVWYMPMALFVALAAGFPCRSRLRQGLLVLLGLLALLELPALTLLIFPIRLKMIDVGAPLTAVLEVALRTQLAPGVTYAMPALLWLILSQLGTWGLSRTTGPDASKTGGGSPVSARSP